MRLLVIGGTNFIGPHLVAGWFTAAMRSPSSTGARPRPICRTRFNILSVIGTTWPIMETTSAASLPTSSWT